MEVVELLVTLPDVLVLSDGLVDVDIVPVAV